MSLNRLKKGSSFLAEFNLILAGQLLLPIYSVRNFFHINSEYILKSNNYNRIKKDQWPGGSGTKNRRLSLFVCWFEIGWDDQSYHYSFFRFFG
jgi:hypothetical protein